MNMEEIWKDIIGYEGLYQVSNYGRVKSLSKEKIGKHNTVYFTKEIILKYGVQTNGYYNVSLYTDGKPITKTIHRLVAQAFIPNPNNYSQVNHKDENKHNNFVWINEDGSVDLEKSNLEWCTAKYNCNYGSRNDKMLDNRSGMFRRKIVLKYDLEGNYIEEYPSLSEASRNTCVCAQSILNVITGKRKTCGGFKWRYK